MIRRIREEAGRRAMSVTGELVSAEQLTCAGIRARVEGRGGRVAARVEGRGARDSRRVAAACVFVQTADVVMERRARCLAAQCRGLELR